MNEKQLSRIIEAYAHFVPQAFLQLLNHEDITTLRLGDQIEQNMTVLFSDIRDFTAISEEMKPQQTFKFLNAYLGQMEPAISAHHGIIDKFIGDAIMAIFPVNADDAVQSGIEMLTRLKAYNRQSGFPEISIGIGINTGLAMLGAIGGTTRMESTVISDAVNLASRLEGVNKIYGTQLLVSEHTFYALSDPSRYCIRFIDRVTVKGKIQPQSVYEVFDADNEQLRSRKLKNLRLFEEALAHYHYRHIEKAKELLLKYLAEVPDDRPALVYLERCDHFFKTGLHESTGELSNSLAWHEEYNIGVDEIDEQHRELFSRANQLLHTFDNNGDSRDIEALLEFLSSYVVQHFNAEEKLMEAHDYPFTANQKFQHEKLKEYFSKIKNELINGSEEDRFYTVFRFQLLVVDWLANHTSREDRHLGRFLRSIQAPDER